MSAPKHLLVSFLIVFEALISWSNAGSPLIIHGPCHNNFFYYENYASYKCIDGRKVLQNCVPMNEPNSEAIAINSTLITTHFRSICVQYDSNHVQFMRTHCVDNTEDMPKFMKPGSENDYAKMKIICKFDKTIQTLVRIIKLKKKRKICKHKKDKKVISDVLYLCKRNAFVPIECQGKDFQGNLMSVPLGKEKADGANYLYSCDLIKLVQKPKKKDSALQTKLLETFIILAGTKRAVNEVVFRRKKCLHYKDDGKTYDEIEVDGENLVLPDGTIVICTNSTGYLQKIYRTGNQTTVDVEQKDCVDPLNSKSIIKEGGTHYFNGNQYICMKEKSMLKLRLVGCINSEGGSMKPNETFGDPLGSEYQTCGAEEGLVTYYDKSCDYNGTKIPSGSYHIIPSDKSLRPRLICKRQSMVTSNSSKSDGNHKVYWNVLKFNDCVDKNGSPVPINGIDPDFAESPKYSLQEKLVEFCSSPGVGGLLEIGRGSAKTCKYLGRTYQFNETFVAGQDYLVCNLNGVVEKTGCFYAPTQLHLKLGEVVNVDDETYVRCENSSTGYVLTNKPKMCEKDLGEEAPFGATYEDSTSIKVCSRQTIGPVTGVWLLTHCIFGIMKIKKGQCFFAFNNYSRCEEDSHHRPVYTPATYEECAPKREVTVTDDKGAVVDKHVTVINQTDFEKKSFIGVNVPDMKPIGSEEGDEQYSDEEFVSEEHDEELEDNHSSPKHDRSKPKRNRVSKTNIGEDREKEEEVNKPTTRKPTKGKRLKMSKNSANERDDEEDSSPEESKEEDSEKKTPITQNTKSHENTEDDLPKLTPENSEEGVDSGDQYSPKSTMAETTQEKESEEEEIVEEEEVITANFKNNGSTTQEAEASGAQEDRKTIVEQTISSKGDKEESPEKENISTKEGELEITSNSTASSGEETKEEGVEDVVIKPNSSAGLESSEEGEKTLEDEEESTSSDTETRVEETISTSTTSVSALEDEGVDLTTLSPHTSNGRKVEEEQKYNEISIKPTANINSSSSSEEEGREVDETPISEQSEEVVEVVKAPALNSATSGDEEQVEEIEEEAIVSTKNKADPNDSITKTPQEDDLSKGLSSETSQESLEQEVGTLGLNSTTSVFGKEMEQEEVFEISNKAKDEPNKTTSASDDQTEEKTPSSAKSTTKAMEESTSVETPTIRQSQEQEWDETNSEPTTTTSKSLEGEEEEVNKMPEESKSGERAGSEKSTEVTEHTTQSQRLATGSGEIDSLSTTTTTPTAVVTSSKEEDNFPKAFSPETKEKSNSPASFSEEYLEVTTSNPGNGREIDEINSEKVTSKPAKKEYSNTAHTSTPDSHPACEEEMEKEQTSGEEPLEPAETSTSGELSTTGSAAERSGPVEETTASTTSQPKQDNSKEKEVLKPSGREESTGSSPEDMSKSLSVESEGLSSTTEATTPQNLGNDDWSIMPDQDPKSEERVPERTRANHHKGVEEKPLSPVGASSHSASCESSSTEDITLEQEKSAQNMTSLWPKTSKLAFGEEDSNTFSSRIDEEEEEPKIIEATTENYVFDTTPTPEFTANLPLFMTEDATTTTPTTTTSEEPTIGNDVANVVEETSVCPESDLSMEKEPTKIDGREGVVGETDADESIEIGISEDDKPAVQTHSKTNQPALRPLSGEESNSNFKADQSDQEQEGEVEESTTPGITIATTASHQKSSEVEVECGEEEELTSTTKPEEYESVEQVTPMAIEKAESAEGEPKGVNAEEFEWESQQEVTPETRSDSQEQEETTTTMTTIRNNPEFVPSSDETGEFVQEKDLVEPDDKSPFSVEEEPSEVDWQEVRTSSDAVTSQVVYHHIIHTKPPGSASSGEKMFEGEDYMNTPRKVSGSNYGELLSKQKRRKEKHQKAQDSKDAFAIEESTEKSSFNYAPHMAELRKILSGKGESTSNQESFEVYRRGHAIRNQKKRGGCAGKKSNRCDQDLQSDYRVFSIKEDYSVEEDECKNELWDALCESLKSMCLPTSSTIRTVRYLRAYLDAEDGDLEKQLHYVASIIPDNEKHKESMKKAIQRLLDLLSLLDCENSLIRLILDEKAEEFLDEMLRAKVEDDRACALLQKRCVKSRGRAKHHHSIRRRLYCRRFKFQCFGEKSTLRKYFGTILRDYELSRQTKWGKADKKENISKLCAKTCKRCMSFNDSFQEEESPESPCKEKK